MEFLDFDCDKLIQIEKRNLVKYDFPVVSFFKYSGSPLAFFNKACKEEFCYAKFLKVYGNAEYMVFQPTNTADVHCFTIYYHQKVNPKIAAAGFERFAVVGKTFRLYKTKKGFAIKLNEPLLDRKE